MKRASYLVEGHRLKEILSLSRDTERDTKVDAVNRIYRRNDHLSGRYILTSGSIESAPT